jgi:hypothetical protein
MIAECAGDASGLHNMSCPPRSTINVSALRASGDHTLTSATGLRIAGCFQLAHVWRTLLDGELFLRLTADGEAMSLAAKHTLVVALLLARAVDGAAVVACDIDAVRKKSRESLEDELFTRLRRWHPIVMHLPRIGFIEHARNESSDAHTGVPLDDSPARTLYVLAHQRGRMFLRDEAPTGFSVTVLWCHRLLVPVTGAR